MAADYRTVRLRVRCYAGVTRPDYPFRSRSGRPREHVIDVKKAAGSFVSFRESVAAKTAASAEEAKTGTTPGSPEAPSGRLATEDVFERAEVGPHSSLRAALAGASDGAPDIGPGGLPASGDAAAQERHTADALSRELAALGIPADQGTLEAITAAIGQGGQGATGLALFLAWQIARAGDGDPGATAELSDLVGAFAEGPEAQGAAVDRLLVEPGLLPVDAEMTRQAATLGPQQAAALLGAALQEPGSPAHELSEKAQEELQRTLPELLVALGSRVPPPLWSLLQPG